LGQKISTNVKKNNFKNYYLRFNSLCLSLSLSLSLEENRRFGIRRMKQGGGRYLSLSRVCCAEESHRFGRKENAVTRYCFAFLRILFAYIK